MPCAIGIDVGGTKIAAGVVDLQSGAIQLRRQQPTAASRPGDAVLADVFAIAKSLLADAHVHGLEPATIGIGVAELVTPDGVVVSDATIRWKGLPIQERFERLLPTCIEADVRAAARAEARWGTGAGLASFLYVTVGTGISSCLVLDGEPHRGARGLSGTFASASTFVPTKDGEIAETPPLERFASGSALALRFRQLNPKSSAEAPEILSLADAGDPVALKIIRSGGLALGSALAQLVNVLDPQAVIVGGGLGLGSGSFRSAVENGFRDHLWSPLHTDISLLPAGLGSDAGLIGAALISVLSRKHPKN